MSARSLRYSLSLDREEFDNAERLVKAVLLTGSKKPRPFGTLLQVTENVDSLPDHDREYIEEWPSEQKGNLEGLCCWSPDDDWEFRIWLSPKLDPLSDLYRLSLLHELVHGYMNYSPHDAKFRDVLGRAMYHYCDIVTPLQSPGFETVALNMRYTRRKKCEDGDAYFRRLVADKEAIQARAEAEYDDVREMYERIA